jgi:hypothetical protein
MMRSRAIANTHSLNPVRTTHSKRGLEIVAEGAVAALPTTPTLPALWRSDQLTLRGTNGVH